MTRGDVVLADFPFQDIAGGKIRPAVVVQGDIDNQTSRNTILAMITGNLRDAAHPASVFVDPFSGEGLGCGLRGPSLIKCANLVTVRQQRVLHVIGKLGAGVLQELDRGLKAAPDLE